MRNTLLWSGIVFCLIVVVLCVAAAFLAAYSNVSEIGFLIFALPFVVEAIILFKRTRAPSRGGLAKPAINLIVFSACVLSLAIGVNLIHDPLAFARSRPILAAVDDYKDEHGKYPANLSLLEIEYDDRAIHYETDGLADYYRLTIASGILFEKYCYYSVISVGPSRGRRQARCINRNF